MLNLQNKLRLSIAALLVLGLILVYQLSTDADQVDTENYSDRIDSIDFFVSEGIVTQWNILGERTAVTTADYAEHFENRQLIELDYPFRVGIREDESIAHQLSAVSGTFLDDNSRIDLAGNVELHHNPDTDQDTTLFTEQLSYHPNSGLAETDQPVEFFNNSGNTKAVGMEFFTREDRLELLSNVRGIHVPTTKD